MNCEEALVLISGHLDHENTVSEETQLQKHLEHCPACRTLLETMQRNDVLLSRQTQVPSALHSRVMEQIAAEPKTKRRPWTGLAAAAALALVIGAAAWQNKPVQQDAGVPMTARMLPGEAVVSADQTISADPQSLADERCAVIVVTKQLLPEMELCSCETLEDGSLLYVLKDGAAASALSAQYDLALYTPSEGEAAAAYAWLMP